MGGRPRHERVGEPVSVAVQPCGGYPSAASGAPHRPGIHNWRFPDEVASVGCQSGGPWSERRHCHGPDRPRTAGAASAGAGRREQARPELRHRLRPGQGPFQPGRRRRHQRRDQGPAGRLRQARVAVPAAADGRPARRPAAAHDEQGARRLREGCQREQGQVHRLPHRQPRQAGRHRPAQRRAVPRDRAGHRRQAYPGKDAGFRISRNGPLPFEE